MLLMKSGEQAWLLLSDGGNHEFARVFYFTDPRKPEAGPTYRLRDGFNRLGNQELHGIDLDEKGARLSWSGGAKSFIPSAWYQLTWR